MTVPRVDTDTAHLAEVVPSLLAALGADGFDNTLELPRSSSACVLLIDGLGAELLEEHAADAPTLHALRAGTLHVGFPSTTAAGLAAVGTGAQSGEHGMVGYSFELGEHGVVNALRWNQHPYGRDLRAELSPEEIQPLPTAFERARRDGVDVHVVSAAAFSDSGLTRAVLRGAPYTGVHGVGDLVASTAEVLAAGPGLCYAYHADLDFIGHLYGPGSLAWRIQLRQVDRFVASLLEELPPATTLAVVADHGMVAVDDTAVDADSTPALATGVRALGGEVRARHVYAEAGAAADVLAAWRETLGERAWVLERKAAIEAGWFGPRVGDQARKRIGDVVVAARGQSGVLRGSEEPIESSLRGHHGSVTTAEQLVPLLLAHR
ncbi:Type I phosphodiesterase / nucleotide pyrophosphatase [Haloechinothrix alba]|uniref:Type I phosphodiesterase / nucleotide pyrophosphatase n=1 Tax=Haloechinothrix alba TaxID=664784 RepID=A0A238ZCR7_9PSEU|nr:nucleotide pyrophosphatase/phosphodiesterase family protein [Haloechinothrix alba]SNR81315.1 Type I phosphodiesterase / nucleotide pyrophosphatase [Haloechinothrix alba]